MLTFETTIEIAGEEVDVEVTGKYVPGSAGSYYVQGDPATGDIISVKRCDNGEPVPDEATEPHVEAWSDKLVELGEDALEASWDDRRDWEKDED